MLCRKRQHRGDRVGHRRVRIGSRVHVRAYRAAMGKSGGVALRTAESRVGTGLVLDDSRNRAEHHARRWAHARDRIRCRGDFDQRFGAAECKCCPVLDGLRCRGGLLGGRRLHPCGGAVGSNGVARCHRSRHGRGSGHPAPAIGSRAQGRARGEVLAMGHCRAVRRDPRYPAAERAAGHHVA